MTSQVKDFLASFRTDEPETQEKLQAVKSFVDLLSLAQSQGFNFTEEEFNDEISEIVSKVDPAIIAKLINPEQDSDCELTPEELESISGGITPTAAVLPFGYGTGILLATGFWGAVWAVK
jgi:predicted ribosomally synthesized peptide with nif11-like leader